MKSFESSAERRFYTSVNWASKEKQQMRMKVQDHSSTARAKRAHQVLMHRLNKFIASTRMDVDHRKIRRKISDLYSKKERIGRMILGEIITKLGRLCKPRP
jgi:hypothetical protein